MSLLTSPHQPPPPPPASASPSAVPNGPQSPKQQKEPLSHRFNEFMTSKPKIHCFRSLKRGVSPARTLSPAGALVACSLGVTYFVCEWTCCVLPRRGPVRTCGSRQAVRERRKRRKRGGRKAGRLEGAIPSRVLSVFSTFQKDLSPLPF